MGWEQRLYAFLLRRVLGPYLTPDSLQKLHESTEVSLQEGRICLSNIELKSEYLTSKQDMVSIHHAIIRKLEVTLSVGDPKAKDNATSITWRAMNWSREDAGISLLAHIEIDGLEVKLGPPTQFHDENYKDCVQDKKEESKTTSSSVVSSYIDAAISSLQLNANLKNVKIQMTDGSQGIQIEMAYAKYYDQDSHDLSMCKVIDFSGISIESCQKECHKLIAKIDGGGKISIKTKRSGNDGHLQQDITLNLYRRMNLSVSETSMEHLLNIIDHYNAPKKGFPSHDKMATSEYFESTSEVLLDDEQDEKLVKDIMEQYIEAREFAERNEVRGGILIADSDTSSFDAFFDANDLSFSNYISTLEESLVMSRNSENSTHFIDTRLKAHLGECRIKISFPKRATELTAEYVLLTFGDLNSISTMSGKSSDLSFTIHRCEAEASLASSNSRPEIKTLFSFEQKEDLNSTVAESPCIDLQIKGGKKFKNTANLRLQRLRVEYCNKTMENFHLMAESLKLRQVIATRPDSVTSAESNESTYFSICTDGVTLLLPIGHELSNSTLNSMFERCGYSSPDETNLSQKAVGLSLEGILISNQAQEASSCTFTEEFEVSCLRILIFVTAPLSDLGGENRTHRMDILSLSGHVPLSAKYTKTLKTFNTSVSHGESIFPKVPAISSFKAREDDDDEIGENSRSEIFTSLRSPDPQPVMLKHAKSCTTILSLKIPDICADLTKAEIDYLTKILSDCIKKKEDAAAPIRTKDDYTTIAFAIHVENATVCIHNEQNNFSLKILGRRWNFFTVLEDSTIRCARALTHEFDLYSCQQLVYRESNKHHFEQLSVCDRCDAIRQRTVRNADTKGIPMLYRSQLFSPLSPESPAILLDLLNGSDQSYSEWTIHISLYNMTHRCGVESIWYTQLFNFFGLDEGVPKQKEVTGIAKGATKPGLTKVFVTIADCNLDYSTPKVFNRGSRSILRFSDIRFSSNIVSPPQPIQTFRLSIDDASLLIGNKRHSYNAENACLFQSVTILSPEDVDVINSRKAAPDLQQMNLVTIFTMDSFIANVSKTSIENQTYIQTHGINEPTITAQLTCGQLCLYGCKDSFECFNETAGELLLKLTGLTSDQISTLKNMKPEEYDFNNECASDSSEDNFFDSNQGELDDELDNVTEICPPLVEKSVEVTIVNEKSHDDDDFELGGYDWTTIDHEWSKEDLPQGEEQVARWYGDRSGQQNEEGNRRAMVSPLASDAKGTIKKTKLISHYIQLKPSLDPLAEGTMDAARHAGISNQPSVSVRLLIRDLKLRCRFFDGYDWPKEVIERSDGDDVRNLSKSQGELKMTNQDRKETLMEALLNEDLTAESQTPTFENIPLPEERGAMLKERAEIRRLSRRINRFVQVSLSGLKMRADLFEKSRRHRLASCVELKVQDFFLAETISNSQPVKMLGEWLNDIEHPRDTNHGLIMMKMVTWKPKALFTFDDQICSDEAEAVVQFLPLRCHINQHAVRFLQSFFCSEGEKKERLWASDLTEVPPPLFLNFKVRPCKQKINYNPEKVNFEALRDGSIVELVNLSPLNDMLITLQSVNMKNKVGFGDVFSALVSNWIQDISSTQLYKFVTNSSPFQPMTSIGTGAMDMVILPWDAVQNGDSVVQAISVGLKSFTGSVVYETLNVTAKLTGLASRQLSKLMSSQQRSASLVLPSRPSVLPRNVNDTADHAIDSIAKGFETASYKVIIIPYREYKRKGVTRAAESIVKGIPVAILAPIGGASEALSYTLLGARNQVRPDIRKEEEASQRELRRGL
mmetsp:Transcript_31462/g.47562  ORF Transcript_31462/g.47562 Transcript_31462/m.47562 type:complete len:1784 (+) Transcript_31462:66-5417(+)